MRDIANISGYAADTNDRTWQTSEHGETETGIAIMALVSICCNLVAELLTRLMNDDDLGFPPEIAFTTAGLDAWTRLPNNEMSFIFDGGSQGNHELWVTSTRLPHPDGTLRRIQHVPWSG